MLSLYVGLHPRPPAFLAGRARRLNRVFAEMMWRTLWVHAMNGDFKGMESYAKSMIDTNKPHRYGIIDLCAHFSVLCGIDIDPTGEDAYNWIFDNMETVI